MLTLTENAATVIKGLATQIEGTDQAGLRIGAKEGDTSSLAVELAPAPVEGDEVVEQDGSRVFLDATASPQLTDKELDALISEGNVRFSLRPRS